MLQVYLVRHGETEWNAARRIQGQSDSMLTDNGVHQARQVAQRVRNRSGGACRRSLGNATAYWCMTARAVW